MKKTISLVLAVALLVSMASLFSACSGSESITVYNWGEYIDKSVLDDFEEETGIAVNYKTFETNEALYSTLKTGGSNIDVIITSDYMVGRLIKEGMVQKLNYDNIPNFSKVGEGQKNLNYDPNNEYTVPYMWGTVGIIYNLSLIHIWNRHDDTSCYSFSRSCPKTASLGSFSALQAQGPSFRFFPHLSQRPLQSSLHSIF